MTVIFFARLSYELGDVSADDVLDDVLHPHGWRWQRPAVMEEILERLPNLPTVIEDVWIDLGCLSHGSSRLGVTAHNRVRPPATAAFHVRKRPAIVQEVV